MRDDVMGHGRTEIPSREGPSARMRWDGLRAHLAAGIFAVMVAPTSASVEQLARDVLARVVQDLPPAERFAITSSTVIMGDGGELDSLGIANFIVGIEEQVEQVYGRALPLADHDLMGLFEGRPVTIGVFAEHLLERLNP